MLHVPVIFTTPKTVKYLCTLAVHLQNRSQEDTNTTQPNYNAAI